MSESIREQVTALVKEVASAQDVATYFGNSSDPKVARTITSTVDSIIALFEGEPQAVEADRTPVIRVRELSADECDERGLDETLRDTGGSPYVLVTVTYRHAAPHASTDFVAVLGEARISPEYLQEV